VCLLQLKEVCYGSRFASLAASKAFRFGSPVSKKAFSRCEHVETGLAICWSPFNEMLNGRPRNYQPTAWF
jgi:hypothetical protein